MRFISTRDYETLKIINKELVNNVLDTPVVIYKLNTAVTKVDIHGDSTSKKYFSGVQVPGMIYRSDAYPMSDIGTLNIEQVVWFAFLRQELVDRNIYPEVGDIIEFNSQYYEIDNINENMLVGDQVIYNHNIKCDAHLTKISSAQLDKMIL